MIHLHHAVRLRLLAQRVSAAGVISPSNCGMSLHALRQLGACNVHDRELLKRIDEVYRQADLRSRANMFHCLACCVREQCSVYKGLPEALPPLITSMQESILGDVDELSPTECILVMEGVVKVTPYRCATTHLAAILRNRSTALVAIVSNPVELIGIARIAVEAMQEAQPHSTETDGGQGEEYRLRLGWSRELREISETIESRLDSFGKQDLLTLVDAITLRVTPEVEKTTGTGEDRLRKLGEWPSRDVPEECRSLLLRVLSSTRQRLTVLSPSQLSAWLLRVVHLHQQHHPIFMSIVQRLGEQHVRSSMSASQLSRCIDSLGETILICHEENFLSLTDLQFVSSVVTKLLETLVHILEKDGGSSEDCSAYLVPAMLSLSEEVVAGNVEILHPLMERFFLILYRHFGKLAPRERADVVTAVFLWGLLNKKPEHQQERQRDAGALKMNGNDVCSPDAWCKVVLNNMDSYSTLDALQIMNEVTSAVYAEEAGACAYSPLLVRPMLLRLHERLQGSIGKLDGVPSSHLTRYLTSISKLGLRRKADYYCVLKILQGRELTDFESLRVLGVVARHHLRAVPLITETVRCIPSRAASLHPKQKCLVLKYLGQVRAQRFVQVPHHPSLAFGAFLTREEVVKEISVLSAMFAFVGLVELRQYENQTIVCLLQGPLSRHDEFFDIHSATSLSEFIAALCRVDRRLVPTKMIQAVLNVVTSRLATSRSFFVDMTDISFWLRLVRERSSLGAEVAAMDRQGESEKEGAEYMTAVSNYVSVAAAIAKTRLMDISGSDDLKTNTFLFNQMAIGYRLGVSLPPEAEERLSCHLDTKHLPQLLSDPRQVINAVTVARQIRHLNPTVAKEVFHFVERNVGSLGAQEALLLGVEMTESLSDAGESKDQVVEMMHKLHALAKQSLNDARRLKKLSVQEVALGALYGVVERPVSSTSR